MANKNKGNNKPATSHPASSSAYDEMSICERPSDLLYVLWFFNFFFAVMFTDIHNFTASVRGVHVRELEEDTGLVWPPPVLTKLYFAWARTIDPLLYLNPMWWQVQEWINLLVLMPTSVIILYGFLRGRNWIRNIALITSSFTWYSLMLCIFVTVYGEHQSPDVPMFLAIYVPYLVFPMCTMWRMWEDKPFSRKKRSALKKFGDTVETLIMTATFVVYFYYIYLWFLTYWPGEDGVVKTHDHVDL